MRPKTISKRDGKFVSFDDVKIRSAIFRAANDGHSQVLHRLQG